ncbi:MAG: 4-hydroxythreonine-4-phosphate dehydrogenase PdxA [Tatlockia sp.]|jgi:4-hydroxythreonine-4-phosphate dehydrogenase
MKPLLVTSGEPAGIGPELCLSLAALPYPIVVLGDKQVLATRAALLKQQITLQDYQAGIPVNPSVNTLTVLSLPCKETPKAGVLNTANASYVIEMLQQGADKCLQGEFSALVTAPVNKAIINEAGIPFTGHTEFFLEQAKVETVVMMLACDAMKVALVTTHLPLRNVADAITAPRIEQIIETLHRALQQDFGIVAPKIYVAGLNPHAGEGGYLGTEEIDSISPALNHLKTKGIDVLGPFPADTLFTPHYLQKADAFVAMYHDQGLPVLKYAGFGRAVNITLGLPYIRTSVDHGTALELAGTGQADAGSLLAAVEMAASMAKSRAK